MKISHEKLALLAKVTTRTIINWEKEERPIIQLIKTYFSDEEIEEYLKETKIDKWNFLLKNYNEEKVENSIALKNIFEDINKEIEIENYMSDSRYLNQMFILFGEIIIFYRKYKNKYPNNEIYDMNEITLLYIKENNYKLQDDIRILNRILNKHIKNKSFLSFILEIERNNFLDIYNDELLKYTKNDLDLYTIYFLIPFWEMKFKNIRIEDYKSAQVHHGKVIKGYQYDNSLTKRELIKLYNTYLETIKG